MNDLPIPSPAPATSASLLAPGSQQARDAGAADSDMAFQQLLSLELRRSAGEGAEAPSEAATGADPDAPSGGGDSAPATGPQELPSALPLDPTLLLPQAGPPLWLAHVARPSGEPGGAGGWEPAAEMAAAVPRREAPWLAPQAATGPVADPLVEAANDAFGQPAAQAEAALAPHTEPASPAAPAMPALPAPAQAASATPAPAATLALPLGHAQWGRELGDQMVWMALNKMQVAQLHLNPAELGPVSITLTLQQDQASAAFVAAQPQVREAIEAAMPRLREMLADNGISLGQTSVSAETPRQPADPRWGAPEPRQGLAREPGQEPPPAGASGPLRRLLGMVDTFA